MINFKQEWNKQAEFVNQSLAEYWHQRFPDVEEDILSYVEALKYSTLGGGKRFRPVLCIKTAEMFGLDRERVKAYALAIELIHCFSLVHDDLPCMDDDDFRRGQATVHKKFDEATALLAGDGLMLEATEILVEKYKEAPSEAVSLIQVLMSAAGSKGMVAGQIIDLQAQKKKMQIEDLEKVHRLKTGALIRASVEGACVLAACDKSTTQSLRSYGELLGLAFQIKDDLLELEEGKSELGSYPGILGEERSRALLEETNLEAYAQLEQFGDRANFLRSIVEYNLKREK